MSMPSQTTAADSPFRLGQNKRIISPSHELTCDVKLDSAEQNQGCDTGDGRDEANTENGNQSYLSSMRHLKLADDNMWCI